MSRGAEVIVVGGGVIGAAVGYELARRGLRPLILDHDQPGRATSASAGGLWPVGEAVGLACGVIRGGPAGPNRGEPRARQDAYRTLLALSSRRFPELTAELREVTGLDVEYLTGAGLIYLAYDESEAAIIDQVSAVLPKAVRPTRLSASEARRLEPGLTEELHSAALLEGEHQINPMLLTEALKRAAVNLGARHRGGCQVRRLIRKGERIVGVETGQETVFADLVVNAAGSWAGRLAATVDLDLPIEPVRGQIVLTESLPRLLSSCLSTTGCYLLQKQHGEILVGSTTERVGFDTGVTQEGIAGLSRAAIRALPSLAMTNVKRVWAGLRPASPDELPILGPAERLAGYLNATGGYRTGVLAAPLTALLVAQSAVGEDPVIPLEPFLLSRFGCPDQSAAGSHESVPSL